MMKNDFMFHNVIVGNKLFCVSDVKSFVLNANVSKAGISSRVSK